MASIVGKVNSGLAKAGLRPLTTNNILYYYTPIKGFASYGVLSVQMFTPELFENFHFLVVPQYISLTNACLLNALTGTGLYLYSSQHLARATPKEKVLFSAFGTVMFNLGSMLLWALGRTLAPESPFLRTAMGVGGAATTFYLGHNYLTYLNSLSRPAK